MRRIPLLLISSAALFPCLAYAAPVTVDFSQGSLGALGVTSIVQDGVRVTAVGGELYRWRHGLGVLNPDDPINPAGPELNVGESLRLDLPSGATWLSLTFTSVNLNSHLLVVDIWARVVAEIWAGRDAFAFDTSGTVVVPNAFRTAAELWIVPEGISVDNYSLLHAVTLDIDTVPEPMSLTLMGLGLVVGAWRARRR